MHFRDVPKLGLWRTDFLTGESLWSKEMFIIYGLKPELHSPSVDVLMKYLHRDDRDMVGESIHRATKALSPFSFFHRIVRKDRSVRNIYSMGRFEIETDGKATCRYGICLDVTGLSNADLALVTSTITEVSLPPLALLEMLDSNNKHVAKLLSLASMVHAKMNNVIAKGNSSDSTFIGIEP